MLLPQTKRFDRETMFIRCYAARRIDDPKMGYGGACAAVGMPLAPYQRRLPSRPLSCSRSVVPSTPPVQRGVRVVICTSIALSNAAAECQAPDAVALTR